MYCLKEKEPPDSGAYHHLPAAASFSDVYPSDGENRNRHTYQGLYINANQYLNTCKAILLGSLVHVVLNLLGWSGFFFPWFWLQSDHKSFLAVSFSKLVRKVYRDVFNLIFNALTGKNAVVHSEFSGIAVTTVILCQSLGRRWLEYHAQHPKSGEMLLLRARAPCRQSPPQEDVWAAVMQTLRLHSTSHLAQLFYFQWPAQGHLLKQFMTVLSNACTSFLDPHECYWTYFAHCTADLNTSQKNKWRLAQIISNMLWECFVIYFWPHKATKQNWEKKHNQICCEWVTDLANSLYLHTNTCTHIFCICTHIQVYIHTWFPHTLQ